MKKNIGISIGIIFVFLGFLMFISNFFVVAIGFSLRYMPILVGGGMVLIFIGMFTIGLSNARHIKGKSSSTTSDVFKQIEDLSRKNEGVLENGKAEEMVTCSYCGSKNSSKNSKCKYCNANLK